MVNGPREAVFSQASPLERHTSDEQWQQPQPASPGGLIHEIEPLRRAEGREKNLVAAAGCGCTMLPTFGGQNGNPE